MFRRPDRNHRPMFRPNMPFGPMMVKELSQLVFLWTVTEEPEGITGYDLQKNYDVKQTNVYRVLKEMEELEYLTSEESIVKGRAQKIYKATEKGTERLKELREKWTNRIAFLSDIAPMDRRQRPPPIFHHRRRQDLYEYLKQIETKEEMMDSLSHLKSHYEKRKQRLEKSLVGTNSRISRVEEFTKQIEEMEQLDSEKIELLINDILKKRKKEKE